ncbi:MAG: hypothetical protein INR71_16275 [Terriglobus roseus]|nr:hypothetical protein [Terriglobus roseus]
MAEIRIRAAVEVSSGPEACCPQAFGLLTPRITLGLHLLYMGVKVSRVDGGVHQHVLPGGKLQPEFGEFCREGQEQDSGVIIHPGFCATARRRVYLARPWRQPLPMFC